MAQGSENTGKAAAAVETGPNSRQAKAPAPPPVAPGNPAGLRPGSAPRPGAEAPPRPAAGQRPGAMLPVPSGPQAQARAQQSQARPQTQARPHAAAGPGRRVVRRRYRLRFRLLPVTIFVAVLMLGVRVGDIWREVRQGATLQTVGALQTQSAAAAETKAPAKPEAKGESKGEAKPAAGAETPSVDAPDEPKLAPVDMEVIKNIASRREELERRTRSLDQREALLVATEKRLEQKLSELQGVRGEIQGLLKQVDDKQKAQIESLVRIYEVMKPKEAARIFEALDQPVLLEVVERMKEAKTAPILAAMDPLKAKELTLALAERRKLPSMPQ